jgi:putative RNA 2'-phosphotransferase
MRWANEERETDGRDDRQKSETKGWRKEISKFLALVLRHRAAQYGIEVQDGTGYADLDEVEALLVKRFRLRVSRKQLLDLAGSSPDGKIRFQIEGRRIRALYGHSQVTVRYEPATPPEYLYHGTSRNAKTSILDEGLLSMGRRYVHLASNPDYALSVAGRHCRTPAVFRIRAAAAAAAGLEFHCPDGVHWLAASVPPEWLEEL